MGYASQFQNGIAEIRDSMCFKTEYSGRNVISFQIFFKIREKIIPYHNQIRFKVEDFLEINVAYGCNFRNGLNLSRIIRQTVYSDNVSSQSERVKIFCNIRSK